MNANVLKSDTVARDYLRSDEVARALRVHDETIRRALRGGRLKGIKIGRNWRIAATELDRVGKGGL